MRFYIFFTLLFLYASNCFSQKNIGVQYIETVNNDFPFKMNNYLFVDLENKKSYYLMDYTNQEETVEIPDETQKLKKESDVFAIADRKESVIYDYVTINHKNKTVIQYEDFYKTFFKIKDEYPNLDWQLTSETKKIDNLDCKKAVVQYRGMTWIAWYTPSIALPYGPWKLHGLPGIIVEAYNETNQFHFKMSLFSENISENIKEPETLVDKTVTIEEFLIYQDSFHNTPWDLGDDITDTSETFNFLESSREKEFEFDITFSWEKEK